MNIAFEWHRCNIRCLCCVMSREIGSLEEQLYDRCIMLHTTFIPYREFEEVLGIKGIDEYIRYGGTMSLSGINYNADTTFTI